MIPNPIAPGFDLANALVCARASAAAYNVDRDHESVLTGCRWIVSAATGTQLLIAADDHAVVIAFAGTQPGDFQDWLTDLKFRRVTTDHTDHTDGESSTLNSQLSTSASIHRGFLAAWQSVGSRVLPAVLELRQGKPKPVFVTGHSLGGALAVLCARALHSTLNLQPSTFTFGQPRVGNSQFAADFQRTLGEHTWRIVHEEDLVPRLPLWTCGYRHCGHEVFLPSFPAVPGGSEYLVDPSLATKCVSDLIGLWRGWTRGQEQLLADHAISRYIARLESLADRDCTSRSNPTPN